jgi:hypothetical protein
MMRKLFITFILIILFSANAIAEVRKKTYDNGYYIGEYSNNQRHGYGIYYFDSGHIEKARWQNGKKVSGSYHWPSGNKFVGRLGNPWYGKFFYADGSSEFQKNKNDKWINSNFSESNTYYVRGNYDSQQADIKVNEFKNRPVEKTRYCRNSKGRVYKRISTSCFSSEREITYTEYKKIIENTKTRYCKKSDGTVHTRLQATSCASFEKELTSTQYNRIKKLIPINETYVVKANFLNVRFEPWTGSKKLTSLKKGTEVFVIGKVKNNSWYYIKQGFVDSKYLKKKWQGPSFNPGTIVTIGLGLFLLYLFASGGKKKKTSRYKTTPYKTTTAKKTSYTKTTSRTSSTTKSPKVYGSAKKEASVKGKKTSNVGTIIIKKSMKTKKKGIICKYCDTENMASAINCIACNKSLS